MHLEDALEQIADIRRHMVRSEVFRGCRSVTVGFSGVAGVLGAFAQAKWIPSPEAELGNYLALWIGIATVSLLVAGAEMFWRAWRAGPGLAREQTVLLVQQFLPSLVVGGLLTVCVYRAAPNAAWMLPGLWSMLFGLGSFAAHRLLPRQMVWVGAYFVVCGCAWLWWGQGERAFSPWMMGVSFGGGQLLSAAILYWNLERTHDAAS